MPALDGEPSREGEHLAEKYLLGKRLGAGGMGEVYRAQNTLIGRTVAIKVLRREHAEDKEVVGRFLREARAANIVRHPNVVDVLDIGQDSTGTPFIVQELLEGEDLSEHVAGAGGRLPVVEVIRILVPVVEAVALGHAKGVIHRDLKPDNVFLARQAGKIVPKLLDFGISQIALAAGELRLTAASFSMGTPAYMSPEHIQGTHLDAGTDVWAIGIMLHELVSGKLPFRGETPASLFVQVCTEDAIPLSEAAPHAPPEFARIVARCLRRDRTQRYANAGELANDLRAIGDPDVPQKPAVLAKVPELVVPEPRAEPVATPIELEDVRPAMKSGISLNAPVHRPSRPRPLIGIRESAEPKASLDPRISAGVVLFVALTVGAAASGYAYDALHVADLLGSLRALASAAPIAIGVILLAGAGFGIAQTARSLTDEMTIGHYGRVPGELAFAMVLGAALYVAVRCLS